MRKKFEDRSSSSFSSDDDVVKICPAYTALLSAVLSLKVLYVCCVDTQTQTIYSVLPIPPVPIPLQYSYNALSHTVTGKVTFQLFLSVGMAAATAIQKNHH